jgi:hypothetical protein
MSLCIDQDAGYSGSHGRHYPDGAGIDTVSIQARQRLAAEAVVADTADKCDAGALARRGDRLIRTLPARDLSKFIAGDCLTQRRHARRAEDQIHIDAADYRDAWFHFLQVLIVRRRGSGADSASGWVSLTGST